MSASTGRGSLLPFHSGGEPAYPSRLYVSLFAWFGLIVGALHFMSGRVLGLAEIIVSFIGIYATWNDVHTRMCYIAAFAFGWCIQAVVETLFLLLLLAALSSRTSQFVAGMIASSTFQNISVPLASLFETLKADVGGFAIFSSFTSVVFAWMACSYSIGLWKEVQSVAAPVSHPNDRTPLMRRDPPQRSNVGGFGSLGQTPRPQPPQRPSFQGKGQRLGFE